MEERQGEGLSSFVAALLGDCGHQWKVVSSSVGTGRLWVGCGHPWALDIHGIGGRGGQWGLSVGTGGL